jgi:F-type H+-transporting ATPase subunit a
MLAIVSPESGSVMRGIVNAIWSRVVETLGLGERFGDVTVPDHVAMALFVLLLVSVIFIPVGRSLRREQPGRLQGVLEVLVTGVRSMIEGQVGHGSGNRFLPMIGAFGVFILLANLCGMFFFLTPPTQNPNVTFALSITAFLYYNWVGFRRHGIGYLKQLLGPVWWLAPLFIPIEIISHFARALSLGLRLFGNVFGEHLVVGVFVTLVPLLMPLPLMALGVFTATIQTFVFIMLTTVYIAGAEAEHH